MKYLTDISIAPENGFRGLGDGPLANVQGNGISTLSSVISMAIGVMTVVAIIWFVFVFITGAIGMIGAGGDKQAMETARKKITTGIIGLVVVIAAIFIFDLIGTIFGIDLLNISKLFGSIIGTN